MAKYTKQEKAQRAAATRAYRERLQSAGLKSIQVIVPDDEVSKAAVKAYAQNLIEQKQKDQET